MKIMDKINANKIKELANDNILEIMDALSIDYYEKNSYIQGPCPIHEGADNDTAFVYYLNNGTWVCHTQQCHTQIGNDIIAFIRLANKITFQEAIGTICNILNIECPKNATVDMDIFHKENKKFVKRQKEKKEWMRKTQQSFNGNLLRRMSYSNDYFEIRGYNRDLLKSYDIVYCNKKGTTWHGRMIIPVKNINGEVIATTMRSVFSQCKYCTGYHEVGEDCGNKQISPKWLHSSGFIKAESLFNINNASKYIRESKTVIITEGPLDVFRLEQSGIKNSIAIFGTKISTQQIKQLLESGCHRIILSLDGDSAGKQGVDYFKENNKYMLDFKVIEIPDEQDVGDLTKQDVLTIFKKYIDLKYVVKGEQI